MKKYTILWMILMALAINVKAQYSNSSLNGPWFMYQSPLTPFGDSLMYLVFDGNGNITDWSGVGFINGSTYAVSANGAITGTLNIVGEGSFPLAGQLDSQDSGTITADGKNYVLSKVTNQGALKDTLTGVLTTSGYGQKNIMLILNQSGEIISSTGLTLPVSGRVYAHLGVFMGHIITGDTLNDLPWGHISIYGYYSNDSLIGEVVVDAPQNSLRVGPAKLKRTGAASPVNVNVFESNANTITIYPNPSNDIFILNMNSFNNELVEINIYNSTGSLVKNKTLNKNNQKVNTEDLSPGVYFVEVWSAEWVSKQKLIIQR